MSQAPQPQAKVFWCLVPKVEHRESWIWTSFCKLMSVPILMLRDSLSSKTVRWKIAAADAFSNRAHWHQGHAWQVCTKFVSKELLVSLLWICFDPIYAVRVVFDFLAVHHLLHGRQLDFLPPLFLFCCNALLLVQCNTCNWLLLVVVVMGEVD